MSLEESRQPRNVVPRWRLSKNLARAPDSGSDLRRSNWVEIEAVSELEVLNAGFSAAPSISLAAEIVGAAVVEGAPEKGAHAAAYILRSGLASHPLTVTATKLLGILPEEKTGDHDDLFGAPNAYRMALSTARQRVRNDYVSPLAWLDLAFLENLRGNLRAADRSIAVALRYGGDSRVVVRAASQFFVHKGEPDRAVRLLEGMKHLRSDPWLLAAHIAVESEFREPRLVGTGLKALKSGAISGIDASELSAAVATEEVRFGAHKKAVKISKLGLQRPTENSLAQLVWLGGASGQLFLEPASVQAVADAFEARARMQYSEQNWTGCVSAAWRWLADQPFSERAASFGSFVALTFMQDAEQALNFAKSGLLANSNSYMLSNNAAVAHFILNQVPEGLDILRRGPSPKSLDESVIRSATLGLAAFRSGDVERARSLYEESFSTATRHRDARAAAFNRIYLAREEARIGEGRRAVDALGELPDIGLLGPEFSVLRETLKRESVGIGQNRIDHSAN